MSLGRKIERSTKRFWYGIIDTFLRNERFEGKLKPAEVRKVLFLRNDAIGDMIVTLPTFRLLKELIPTVEIHVLASPVNAPLLKNDPNLDRVIIYDGNLLKSFKKLSSLRSEKYDVIFSCRITKITDNGILANIISDRDTVKVTTWAEPLRYVFFNKQSHLAQKPEKMWEKMAALVLDTIETDHTGIPEIEPYIATNAESNVTADAELDKLSFLKKKFIAINISTRNERNRWTTEGYQFVIKEFLKENPTAKVLILWMGDDEAQARQIITGYEDRAALYRRTADIMEIVRVVENAACVLSTDTGIVHICSAVKTPVLAMYVGENHPARLWEPYKIPFRAIETEGDNYVATLEPEQVWSEFKNLLDEIPLFFLISIR
ncbi:MAG: glycosyltransferase family 9 protein [Bacteroidota bacterium]